MDKRMRVKIVRNDLPKDVIRKLALADKLSLTVSAMSKALDDPDMSEKAVRDAIDLADAVERANEAYIGVGRGLIEQNFVNQVQANVLHTTPSGAISTIREGVSRDTLDETGATI